MDKRIHPLFLWDVISRWCLTFNGGVEAACEVKAWINNHIPKSDQGWKNWGRVWIVSICGFHYHQEEISSCSLCRFVCLTMNYFTDDKNELWFKRQPCTCRGLKFNFYMRMFALFSHLKKAISTLDLKFKLCVRKWRVYPSMSWVMNIR